MISKQLLNLQLCKSRFTRNDLSTKLPFLSFEQIGKIISLKEELFVKFLQNTTPNTQLFKLLTLIAISGFRTILLTDSSKARALQVCTYHQITPFFSELYYKEDYKEYNKYFFLNKHLTSLNDVVLFENEHTEIMKAIQCGIQERQIITIQF